MRDGETGYAPAAGIPALRDALAQDIGAARGVAYSAENVSVQPGGKPIISKFLLSVMQPGDGVLFPNPGYPIYESQVEFLGGVGQPYGFKVENGRFRIDRESLLAAVTPSTRVLILNPGHNPTGADTTQDELQWLAELALERDLWVLTDEPYFDIRYAGHSLSIVSLPGMQERTVVAHTFSKKYAMTGWRLGAAVGPTAVIDVITKLNTNHESCTSTFIQRAGVEALTGDQSGVAHILRTLQQRREAVLAELGTIPGVVIPLGEVTFYLFADVTEVYHRLGYTDQTAFRRDALERTGVSFCSRGHFGRVLPGEDRVFVRFAYSGIGVEDARAGLNALRGLWGAPRPD